MAASSSRQEHVTIYRYLRITLTSPNWGLFLTLEERNLWPRSRAMGCIGPESQASMEAGMRKCPLDHMQGSWRRETQRTEKNGCSRAGKIKGVL